MHHHAVDAVAGGEAADRLLHREAEDAAHLALRGEHVVQARRLPGLRRGGGHGGIERFEKVLGAAGVNADGFDHRHAEFAREHGGVDRDALLLGHVGHVERHHHRQAELLRLEHEAQVQAQVGRVGHAHQQVGQGFVALAGDDVAGDGLVGAERIQAVGARQVEHEDAAARGGAQRSFLALDGHAGVVGDLLAAASQQVEERGLAAVGVAEQRNAPRLGSGGETAGSLDDGFSHGWRLPA